MNRLLSALLPLAAALASGCAGDRELRGAAAARSRGAEVVDDAPPTAAPAAAPARPYDPWLDDTRKLATVNGQVIALAQVRLDMGRAYDQYLDRREALVELVNKKVRDLVMRKIIVAEGKRIGMNVSDEEMETDEQDQARVAKARGTTIEQMLRDLEMTRGQWDDDRRDRLFFGRSQAYLLGRFPDFLYNMDRFRPSVESWVSPAEIRAWGARHHADLDRPSTAVLRILWLPAEGFVQAGDGAEGAWARCAAALDALEARLKAGEPFAAVADLGTRLPGTGEGGLHPPVTRDSGELRGQYREWAFDPARQAGDVSERMKVPGGFVILRLESREEAARPDIDEWGPHALVEIQGLRRKMAWSECQARLLEDSAVAPLELKASLLAELRAEARRIRRELDPPEPEVAATIRPR